MDGKPRLKEMKYYIHYVCSFTCLRNLLAIKVSGETSDWPHVGHTWVSDSSKAVRIPGHNKNVLLFNTKV